MREIVLDTETTGLDPAKGDRIVEIGAVELFNHLPTGVTYHTYLNPERDVPSEAAAVHGLTTDFLRPHPVFSAIVEDFSGFIGNTPLIIHNASFDVGFINAEFAKLKREPVLPGRVIDTLQLARRKFPMGPNSLDALCRRFGIDNTKRVKHGALVDAELLAAVYLELIGGRQTSLTLASAGKTIANAKQLLTTQVTRARPESLASRLTVEDLKTHADHVKSLGPDALWAKFGEQK